MPVYWHRGRIFMWFPFLADTNIFIYYLADYVFAKRSLLSLAKPLRTQRTPSFKGGQGRIRISYCRSCEDSWLPRLPRLPYGN